MPSKRSDTVPEIVQSMYRTLINSVVPELIGISKIHRLIDEFHIDLNIIMNKFTFFQLSYFLLSTIAEDAGVLYTDISLANTSESFYRIRDVPMKNYEFKYDSVAGRKQMGVLGVDAQKYFPESVDVVPTYTLPSKDRSKPPVILHNFPVIDKNVIFMHGVAALKELMSLYSKFESNLHEVLLEWDEQKEFFHKIEARLAQDNNDKNIELEKLKKIHTELEAEETRLNKQRLEDLRRTKESELEERRALLTYQENLALARMNHEEELAKSGMEETLKFERELLEKREILRRETVERLQSQRQSFEKELDLKRNQLEMDKIKAEIEAKAEAERANEDMKLRELETQSALDTQRMVESIHILSQQISNVISDFFSRPKQLILIGCMILALIAIYYTIRELLSFIRQYIQSKLGKPLLIRETSVQWSISLFWRYFETAADSMAIITSLFQDVILSDEDRHRVLQLALTTRNTKRAAAPFRHVLLHGPPGTGKTLIARKLAVASGMDYAVMSGGDVGPLGEDAVTQLHSLFKWASKSRRGLLLFIDEAEAFLSSRSGMGADDAHLRHALNALLYQTGTQSRQFMMVLATNRPEDLDSAVLDRIDISMRIGLPDENQRNALLRLYMQLHVVKESLRLQSRWSLWNLFVSRTKVKVDENCLSKERMQILAKKTNGFSGREISKLMIAVQYAMFLSNDGVLTTDLFEATVQAKLKEHQEKKLFTGQKTF